MSLLHFGKIGHALFHVVMIGAQIAAAGVAPPPFNIVVAGSLALIQGIVALRNHRKS